MNTKIIAGNEYAVVKDDSLESIETAAKQLKYSGHNYHRWATHGEHLQMTYRLNKQHTASQICIIEPTSDPLTTTRQKLSLQS